MSWIERVVCSAKTARVEVGGDIDRWLPLSSDASVSPMENAEVAAI